MYPTPRLRTTGIPQEPLIGVRPVRTANDSDTNCQCADCDTNDCGTNNPCGVQPIKPGTEPTMLEHLASLKG
jgi:hypothetical protein